MIVGFMQAVAVDGVHGWVYWSDWSDNKVKRVTVYGNKQTDIYSFHGKLSCVTDQMVWCVIIKHSVVLLTNAIGVKSCEICVRRVW